VRILLQYGANPDLRDEEGKTPLDKARERGEECHREVVQILQQTPPCDFASPASTGLVVSLSSGDMLESAGVDGETQPTTTTAGQEDTKLW
jgi:ankyrin repeat protein